MLVKTEYYSSNQENVKANSKAAYDANPDVRKPHVTVTQLTLRNKSKVHMLAIQLILRNKSKFLVLATQLTLRNKSKPHATATQPILTTGNRHLVTVTMQTLLQRKLLPELTPENSTVQTRMQSA